MLAKLMQPAMRDDWRATRLYGPFRAAASSPTELIQSAARLMRSSS